MNVSESNDLGAVLAWVLGRPRPSRIAAVDDAAREAAARLADRAYRAQGAGIQGHEVRSLWPPVSPPAAASDLAFVVEALDAWQDGTASPNDVLVAIRDQLGRRRPGEDHGGTGGGG